MKRREVITLLGGAALAWPAAAGAEQDRKMPRLGYFELGPSPVATMRLETLRGGLRDLGWIEGKTIAIDIRWAQRVDQLPALAAELARIPVDVIFANSSTFVDADISTKTVDSGCDPKQQTSSSC